MERKHRAALALSLFFTLGLFLGAEGVVRLLGIEPAEWPLDNKRSDFPGVQADPVLGWGLRPDWVGMWAIDQFVVEADERGFRSTGDPVQAAPSRRVAFLGDSCTFGWGMGTGSTFVAKLDDLLRVSGEPACDMMNAAFPGHSAVVGLHILRHRVLPYDPDIVVIAFSAHNAFRFALVSDAERFRFAALRRYVLRSRLLHVVAAWWANRSAPGVDPRQQAAVLRTPVTDLRRVADADEFAAALRTMVGEARAHGATPLFLLLPRKSTVSATDATEDAALAARALPATRPPGDRATPAEVRGLEVSCLDHRSLGDPIGALYQQRDAWRPVYPEDAGVRALLRDGAQAFIDGSYARARERFAAALERQPDSPLAHYDLGVNEVASGDAGAGLRALGEADRLACSAFLHYAFLVWKVAVDLAVPVVDITLSFQGHEGEPLFLDPAHPNRAGHEIVARALLAALTPREQSTGVVAAPAAPAQ